MAVFTLGGRTFPRKTDALAHVREVLWSAEIGQPVTDPAALGLIELHPERTTKTQYGIAAVEVHWNEWNQRCFAIRGDGGELTTFSFRECLNPSPLARQAKDAMRWEIRDQITAFRKRVSLVCEVTGTPVVWQKGQPDSAEVDHAPPNTFDVLAEDWAVTQDGWPNVGHVRENQHRILTVPAQRQDWLDYHHDNATLRLLSARAHRNIGPKT